MREPGKQLRLFAVVGCYPGPSRALGLATSSRRARGPCSAGASRRRPNWAFFFSAGLRWSVSFLLVNLLPRRLPCCVAHLSFWPGASSAALSHLLPALSRCADGLEQAAGCWCRTRTTRISLVRRWTSSPTWQAPSPTRGAPAQGTSLGCLASLTLQPRQRDVHVLRPVRRRVQLARGARLTHRAGPSASRRAAPSTSRRTWGRCWRATG